MADTNQLKYVTHPELIAHSEKIRQIATEQNGIQNRRIDMLEERDRELEIAIKDLSNRQHSLELEVKEVLGLVKNTDGNITSMSQTLFAELREIKSLAQDNSKKIVYLPLIQKSVFGLIGIIVTAVVGAVIGLVIVQGGGI